MNLKITPKKLVGQNTAPERAHQEKSPKEIPTNQTSPKTSKIVVYGGTFDPPHKGHFDSVTALKQRLPEANILIVPALKPATAGHDKKKPSASFHSRVEMLEAGLIARGLLSGKHSTKSTHGSVSICEIEKDLPTPNYSLNTVLALKKLYEKEPMFFLVGRDQLENIDKWHKIKELLSLTGLVVIDRQVLPKDDLENFRKDASENEANSEQSLEELKEILTSTFARMGLTITSSEGHYFVPETETKIILINAATCPASSRLIRETYFKKSRIYFEWIDPAVRNYIVDHNLYGLSD